MSLQTIRNGLYSTLTATGCNLVLNSSFETAGVGGDYYALDEWTGNIKTGGSVLQTTTAGQFRSGSAGLRVHSGTSEGHHTRAEQLWTLKKGRTYLVSLWARGDGTDDGKWAVFDYASEWLTATCSAETHTGVTGSMFAQVTKTFTVGTVDPRCFIGLGATSYDNGFACWDDISVCLLSPFSATEVSTCDFGIIGNVSSCAIVLMPGPNSYIEPLTDGNTRMKRAYWDIAGRGYIKFDGDAQALLSKVWQMHDDIYNVINDDDTLGGTANAAMVKSFNFNPDVAVDAAGALWGVINFRIVAEEF